MFKVFFLNENFFLFSGLPTIVTSLTILFVVCSSFVHRSQQAPVKVMLEPEYEQDEFSGCFRECYSLQQICMSLSSDKAKCDKVQKQCEFECFIPTFGSDKSKGHPNLDNYDNFDFGIDLDPSVKL